jgi:hypothetical protein
MLQWIGILALAQIAYCALFGFIGLVSRWSLVAGLIYIVAIEGVLANLAFVIRALAVVYYVRVLAVRWLDVPADALRRWLREWSLDLTEVPEAGSCVLTLLFLGLAITALSALWFARREFRVKTPEGS